MIVFQRVTVTGGRRGVTSTSSCTGARGTAATAFSVRTIRRGSTASAARTTTTGGGTTSPACLVTAILTVREQYRIVMDWAGKNGERVEPLIGVSYERCKDNDRNFLCINLTGV